jgi:hypothetical protein
LASRSHDLEIILGLWNFAGGVEKARERAGPDCGDKLAISLQQAILFLAEIKKSSEQSRLPEVNIGTGFAPSNKTPTPSTV